MSPFLARKGGWFPARSVEAGVTDPPTPTRATPSGAARSLVTFGDGQALDASFRGADLTFIAPILHALSRNTLETCPWSSGSWRTQHIKVPMNHRVTYLPQFGTPVESALTEQSRGPPSSQRQTRREAGAQSHGSGSEPDSRVALKGGNRRRSS
jgi:hypothetical protein